MPAEPPAAPAPPDLARVDAFLRSQDGRLGDLGGSGRDFARAINRLQRLARMVLVSEDKTFRRTVQRWRLVDADRELELGTERRGAGQFALIARWAAGPASSAAGPAPTSGGTEWGSVDGQDGANTGRRPGND